MLFPNKPVNVNPPSCDSSLPFHSCRNVPQSVLESCCKLVAVLLAVIVDELTKSDPSALVRCSWEASGSLTENSAPRTGLLTMISRKGSSPLHW